MRAFAELYTALDETNKTGAKTDALVRYFQAAAPADAAWALYFLIGRRPRQAVPTARLRAWATEAAGLDDWLFGEAYDAVGDLAETVALVLPDPDGEERWTAAGVAGAVGVAGTQHAASVRIAGGGAVRDDLVGTPHAASLQVWVEQVLLPLRTLDEATQKAAVLAAWATLGGTARFVFNKLITGQFRIGVSQRLVTRALAQVSGVDGDSIAHRLMGEWTPAPLWYASLIAADTTDSDASRPYPFCLAHPLEAEPATLGDLVRWQVEWKWDGIRAQIVRRNGATYVWSRGEELVTERFPELAALGALFPDGTVIDGEALPFKDGVVLPFAQLQRRIGRKDLGKKILSDVPVILLVYDLIELAGKDVRDQPLAWRRAQLDALVTAIAPAADVAADALPVSGSIGLSPLVLATDWEDLARLRDTARDRNAEGFMLKLRESPYRVGRQRGDWWKWKVAPYTIDAVLINAQRGSGKRASLYTDYTFAVWDGDRLVPFAKAYSGLTDAEIREVDAFVRRNTTETFGPVRAVKPELVFELGFEGLQRSTRHKSGVAVRFPRILRRRLDKKIADADTLETIQALVPPV